MKKLYTLAAAAVVAFSASAQSLYFLGSGENLSWDADKALEVKLSEGKYTVTINNLSEFKVSTQAGTTWEDFNPGALYAEGLADAANLGKALPLVTGDGNNGVPYTGDYTIVIPADLSTLTATTTTPAPEGFLKIYLRGTMNDWTAPDNYEMETTDGVIYWFDCQGETMLPAMTQFKIADANWSAVNYGAGDIIFPFDEPMPWFYNGENGAIQVDYTGTIMLNLLNGVRKDAEVTVFPEIVEHKAAVSEIEVATAAPEYFNLQGVRVTNPENGLYIVRRGDKVAKVMIK